MPAPRRTSIFTAVPGLPGPSPWLEPNTHGLQGVSPSLYEAAQIDGARGWAQFRHITLPMLSPYIFFNFIMGTIGALEKLTLDDVRAFYKQNYTQSALVIGLAGGYPSDFPRASRRTSRNSRRARARRRVSVCRGSRPACASR